MKIMDFKVFRDLFIGSIITGFQMVPVYWNSKGDQVILNWSPNTSDLHDKVKHEAEMLMEDEEIEAAADFDMAVDEVIENYKEELDETASAEYEKYLEIVEAGFASYFNW